MMINRKLIRLLIIQGRPGPLRGWGRGGKLPRAPQRLGAPPSARNMKYVRMYHFEKKNSKIFSPERRYKNVWGPHENVFPGIAVGLDGPGVGHKNVPLYFCPYFRQLMTDFQNSFTNTWSSLDPSPLNDAPNSSGEGRF